MERKIFLDLGERKVFPKASPTTDIEAMKASQDEEVRKAAERAEKFDEYTKAQMSPKGALNLTQRLDERRLEYGIIDAAFNELACFDRVLIWQLPVAEETYGDTGIVMTDIAKKKTREETPMGILITAGLGALDVLKSHGHELGDIVKFVKQGMWRLPIGYVLGVPQYLMVLSVGEIVSNNDLAERYVNGDIRYEWSAKEEQHFLVDREGNRLNPKTPFIGADYEA